MKNLNFSLEQDKQHQLLRRQKKEKGAGERPREGGRALPGLSGKKERSTFFKEQNPAGNSSPQGGKGGRRLRFDRGGGARSSPRKVYTSVRTDTVRNLFVAGGGRQYCSNRGKEEGAL